MFFLGGGFCDFTLEAAAGPSELKGFGENPTVEFLRWRRHARRGCFACFRRREHPLRESLLGRRRVFALEMCWRRLVIDSERQLSSYYSWRRLLISMRSKFVVQCVPLLSCTAK